MKDRNVLLLITFSLLLGLASSVFVLYARINTEKNDSVIDISADYGDIERLSTIEKVSVPAILDEFKKAGLTSVALSEMLENSADVNLLIGVDPKKNDLYIPSRGLQREQIKLVEDAGLRVIPRIRNDFNISGALISKKLRDIAGSDVVIFAEEEVLGYPNYLPETAKALKADDIKYGYIEFGKQFGDDDLAALVGDKNTVKVHSVPQEEMENLSESALVQRYVRGARERGIRILYVHLLQYADKDKDLISTNSAFISDLNKELTSYGFSTGKASTLSPVRANSIERIFIAFAVAAGTALLVLFFFPVNFVTIIVLLILFALLPSKLLALISAVVFPSYAVISQFPVKREKSAYGLVSQSILICMTVAGITALGAIFIASILGAAPFSGIKIAFILPVIIVAGYFFFRSEKLDMVFKILDANIKVYHALLFFLIGAAGALLILRSGNFGVPVSGAETHARDFLENMLFVRPRTKEFLIGYPALIIAAIYYLKGGNRWLWFWLMIGVLAPISMINSFCHSHTPLAITVTRSVSGLILGIAVGLIAYGIYWICSRYAGNLGFRSGK